MNRKILLILPMAFLMLFAVASPAMATKAFPATAAITNINYVDFPSMQYVVTNGGVVHMLYFKFGGTIDLTLDSGTPIHVDWMDICTGTYDPATNTGAYKFSEVWTLSGGTFVGMDHPTTVGDLLAAFGVPTGNPPETSIVGHVVLHGTDLYAGQTLNLFLPAGSDTFSGTWLKP